MRVDWATLTEELLQSAIEQQLLNNQTYHEAVKELRDLILDQPLHPLNKTVWWMEYLLR